MIKCPAVLCIFGVLLALACLACKEQSSTSPQTAPSPSSANAPNQPGAASSATPASDANVGPVKGKVDACRLLTVDEIKLVQGDTVKETKASVPSGGPFITTQCFYTTTNFVNSVSLTVTQQSSSTGAQTIKDFWKERFGRPENREKGRQKEGDRTKDAKPVEGEEEGLPPQRVKSIGDEAYWVGNAKIGALYVLTGDKLLRISIGGVQNQKGRVEKMKVLAQHAIKRL